MSVFEDLGFDKEKSQELALRSQLIGKLVEIVERHSYSQRELMAILGQKQPEVSYLLNGKVSKFSSEKLIKFLHKLDADVSIKVKLPRKKVATPQM